MVFFYIYRVSLGVVTQLTMAMPKIPKYSGAKSFFIARKRTIKIITKIIFLKKGYFLILVPFNASSTSTDTQLKPWLKAYISRKLFARFFSFKKVTKEFPHIVVLYIMRK